MRINVKKNSDLMELEEPLAVIKSKPLFANVVAYPRSLSKFTAEPS